MIEGMEYATEKGFYNLSHCVFNVFQFVFKGSIAKKREIGC